MECGLRGEWAGAMSKGPDMKEGERVSEFLRRLAAAPPASDPDEAMDQHRKKIAHTSSASRHPKALLSPDRDGRERGEFEFPARDCRLHRTVCFHRNDTA